MSRGYLMLLGVLALIGIGSAFVVQAQRTPVQEHRPAGADREDDPIPEARIVFQAWRALQRQTSRSYWRIELTEQVASSIDGPAGLLRTASKAQIYGRPDTTHWTRRFVALQNEDEAVPRNEWRNLQKEWAALLGPEIAALAQAVEVPLPRLEAMQPADPVEADTINGRAHWRIEIAPVELAPGREYERVILWVDQEVGYLTRSIALIQTPETSLTTITDYERVNGLDVPHHRTIAGTMSIHRRLRTFTQYFRLDTRYSGYRFYKRSMP